MLRKTKCQRPILLHDRSRQGSTSIETRRHIKPAGPDRGGHWEAVEKGKTERFARDPRLARVLEDKKGWITTTPLKLVRKYFD